MKVRITILIFSMLFMSQLFGQVNSVPTRFWKLSSYYGELRFNGSYRVQKQKGIQINDRMETFFANPALLLRTKSYIWHPRFLVLELDGEYSPSRSRDKFLVTPDQSENMDARKIDARMTLFQENKLSLSAYYNYGRIYNNRENLSSIRSEANNMGSILYYRRKKTGASLSYTNWNQDETEIQTGRIFKNRQAIVEARTNGAFGKYDKHEIVLSRTEYFRKDYGNQEVLNKINNLSLVEHLFFGREKRNEANTFFSAMQQTGHEVFDRYQAIETINLSFTKKLSLNNNYVFFSDIRKDQKQVQHKATIALRHQLYESLQSELSLTYSDIEHTFYNDKLKQASADFAYSKKLMPGSRLDIHYRQYYQIQNWQSGDRIIPVLNEAITLSDGRIQLLSRPYVDLATVQVRDISGSIVYQLNLDYLLIQQGNFIQIQRVAGGQIANNASVYVNYSALQPGNFSYHSNNSFLSLGMTFFDRFLNIYFRNIKQNYSHLQKTDFISLNYFEQKIVGLKLEYSFLTAGIEYDDMKSTILPYKLMRYYLNLQGNISDDLLAAVDANYYDYANLNNVKNLKFADLSGTVTYNLSPRITLFNSVTYRKQQGEGVSLDLFAVRNEARLNIHKLSLSVAYNYYDRKIYNEMIRYNGINLQLIRKF